MRNRYELGKSFIPRGQALTNITREGSDFTLLLRGDRLEVVLTDVEAHLNRNFTILSDGSIGKILERQMGSRIELDVTDRRASLELLLSPLFQPSSLADAA